MILNRQHLNERICRVAVSDRGIVINAMKYVARLAKARKLPNTAWYLTVRNKGTTIAHICGRGCLVATVLSGHMTPVGARL